VEDLRRILERLEQNLDDVKSDLGEIKVVQAEQAADLKHHIFRTDLAEARIEMLQSEINPLSKAYERCKGVFIAVGIISSGLGLIFTAVKAIEFILKIL
jgi:hypothetical protein